MKKRFFFTNLIVSSILVLSSSSIPVHGVKVYSQEELVANHKFIQTHLLSEDETGSCLWLSPEDAIFLIITQSETLPEEWIGHEKELKLTQNTLSDKEKIYQFILSEESANKLSAYGDNIHIFFVWCDAMEFLWPRYIYNPVKINACCRKTYLEKNIDILDTLLLEREIYPTVTWNGKAVYMISGETEKKYDNDSEKLYSAHPEIFDSDGNIILLSEISEKTQLSDYERITEAFSKANEIISSEVNNIAYAVSPGLRINFKKDDTFVIRSAWEQIGDLNSDNKINSLDADEILMISARIGARNDNNLSLSQRCFADINADGEVNAEDASLVLEYNVSIDSENFSGELSEFIRQKVS